MEKRPQKMWVREKVEPSEKFRETIFTTDKNLKDQFVNFNEKRGLQEIKNQTSFIFHLDKVAPDDARKTTIEASWPRRPGSSGSTATTSSKRILIDSEKRYFLLLQSWRRSTSINHWIARSTTRTFKSRPT
jgi:hypothetical protein